MLTVAAQVPGYRIEGVLGHGGMGTVYEATQLSLKRAVALKILSPELGKDVSFRERFRREGEIQAGIDHAHIIPVYEAGETDDRLFIAMRIVRGATLKELVDLRALDAPRALMILAQIADALDAAHEAGLTHRDIKPQNILVDTRGHAYLADFGLTTGSGHSGVNGAGEFLGTLDYIAPEQIRGERVGPASDVYAMGGVLYECLTGVVPYPQPSDAGVLFSHLSDPPPRVTEHRPDLPRGLDAVIARAMSKSAGERHRTASATVEAARRALGSRTATAGARPRPLAAPEQAGIRRDEGRVATKRRSVRIVGATAVDGTIPRVEEPQPSRVGPRAWMLPIAIALLIAAPVAGYLIGNARRPDVPSARSGCVDGPGIAPRSASCTRDPRGGPVPDPGPRH